MLCGDGLIENRSLTISSEEERMAQVAPQILVDRVRAALEGEGRRPLIEFLQRQRWFGGKGRPLADVRLSDVVVISTGTEPRLLAVIIVEYRGGPAERYLAPLSIRPRTEQDGETAIADLPDSSAQQRVHDATNESEWWRRLLRAVAEGKVFIGHSGCVTGRVMPGRQSELGSPWSNVTVLLGEQSNTSVIFDRRVMMKLIRKLESGLNPESEVLEFLTMQTPCTNVPTLLGLMTYDSNGTDDSDLGTVALVQQFIPNHGDGWSYTLARLDELVRHTGGAVPDGGVALRKVVHDAAEKFLSDIRCLGEMTGNLHLALSSRPEAEAFRPEPITDHDYEAWRAGMQKQLVSVCRDLRALPSEQQVAIGLTANEATAMEAACWRRFEDLRMLAQQGIVKIRHHGDYHLGQVLKTDEGFIAIDFEGEPARSLAERRAKVCPLKDVAGMLRSFNYAAHTILKRHPSLFEAGSDIVTDWERAARTAFLDGYRSIAIPGRAMFLPMQWADTMRVLRVYELDKALYELRYELRNRPDWLSIPLQGIRSLTQEAAA
jgi:maltose alpha-D-glucosyltransferase/alpha-amylase